VRALARVAARSGARSPRDPTRRLHRALVLLLAATLAGAGARPAPAGDAHAPATERSPASTVQAVGPIGMTVSDLERSAGFYARVLGFRRTAQVEIAGDAWERLHGVPGLRARVATMALGDESIALTEYGTPRGRPIAEDARANDHAFQHVAIVVRDMARAYAWLRASGVRHASTAPQRLPDWNRDAAGIEAFYFRDPDGHFLEILAFPPDKGAARWHRAGDELFLGIDHTAIVVADTDASLALYRDTLGMRIAGTSDNHGPEQERLNGVAGAHLRITTLRAPHGPGIELLEYLAPEGGRPAPDDLRANDLLHWQTRLVLDDPERAAAALRALPVRLVSRGVVALPDAPAEAAARIVVRDPDGHALELVGPAGR